MAAVRRAPLLAGLNIPNMAKKIVMASIVKICIPDPMTAANNLLLNGGLNTSPWTSFHPVSSMLSSLYSSAMLYLAMSFLSVRMMIMVMMPDRKNTTTTELMMENQWI